MTVNEMWNFFDDMCDSKDVIWVGVQFSNDCWNAEMKYKGDFCEGIPEKYADLKAESFTLWSDGIVINVE